MDFVNHNSFPIPLSRGHCSIDDLPNVFAHIILFHVSTRDIRADDKIRRDQKFCDAGKLRCSIYLRNIFVIGWCKVSWSSPRHIVRKDHSGGSVSMYINSLFDILASKHFCPSDEAVHTLRCKIAGVASLLPRRPLHAPFKFTNATIHALLRAARRVKSNFGDPLRTIPSRAVKQALPIILEAKLHIFNLSICSDIFP